MFLWLEIGYRNLTLIYINEPIVKLVSLYVDSLQVSVSKNLPMMLNEDLLCV